MRTTPKPRDSLAGSGTINGPRSLDMKLITEADIFDCLSKLRTQSKQAQIAVAFWGKGSHDQLGTLPADTRIICNLISGGTNPEEIEKLSKKYDVRQLDTLHAKVYLFDKAAVVGSSNASANGLSYQAEECRGWIEANVLVHEEPLLKNLTAWFERLWANAREITPEDIKTAHDTWSRRRSRIPLPRNLRDGDLLNALTARPDRFTGRRLNLVVFSSYMSQEAENLLRDERERRGSGSDLSAFEDWDELPNDSNLVSFYLGPRGGFRFHGFFQTLPDRYRRSTNKTSLCFCWKIPSLGDLRVINASAWKEPIRRLKDSQFWDTDDGTALIDLGEFATRFLDLERGSPGLLPPSFSVREKMETHPTRSRARPLRSL
jgi:hypothetical protein